MIFKGNLKDFILKLTTLTVVLSILFCSNGVYAGDDIHGSANLSYRSTETKTGEEEKSSWGFSQTYNIQLSKEITPKVNFAADLGINVNETDSSKTTRLTPNLRLDVRNEYFDAGTGYRITEKGLDIFTMSTDEDRYTSESWTSNFSTKSEKYPKIRLRYNEDMDYDHLAVHKKNNKTTSFSGGAEYKYRFLNLFCEYKNDISDDYVTEVTTESDTYDGRINVRQSFWGNKVATSASYSINNKKSETETKGQDVSVDEKEKAYVGLYIQDNTPAVTSNSRSIPALIDGNKNASAGINIGGIGNTYHNIGVDLNKKTDAEKIFLYTETPDPFFNENNFTWAVYSSSDKNAWTLIDRSADFQYSESEHRFEIEIEIEISFAKTQARYFKVVNTSNDMNSLNVTEIEAYSSKTYPAFTTTETEQTSETIQANISYRPTDWLSFIYDFTEDKQTSMDDDEKTRNQTHNINGSVEKELHKYLSARAQYSKRLEYDIKEDDKTTDTYLLHFFSSPLETLDADLSFNHTVSKEASRTQSKSSSALFQVSAMLREGADLDLNANITNSENIASQSETVSKSFGSNLRVELTRRLTGEIEHNRNWTQTEALSTETSDETSNTKCTFNWRPSHDFYYKGSYSIDRNEKTGDETTQQQYNMNWLMTEKMQLSAGYTLNRNDSVSSAWSSDLSWNLSKAIALKFGYNWSCQKSDATTTTQTFSANLSARF